MSKFLNIFVDIDTKNNCVDLNIKTSNGHDIKESANIRTLENTDRFIGGNYIEATSDAKEDSDISVNYYFTVTDGSYCESYPMGGDVAISLGDENNVIFSGETNNGFSLGSNDGSSHIMGGVLAAICLSSFEKARDLRDELLDSFK